MVPRRTPSAAERRFLVLTTIAVSLIVGSIFQLSGASFAAVFRDPKSLGNDLFDAEAFIRARQERRAVLTSSSPGVSSGASPSSLSSSEASSASSVSSSEASSSSSSVSSPLPPLTLWDLSDTQRETLQLQLRIGGCPLEGDARYIALCQDLLSKQQQPETREGLRNPHQQ